MMLVERLRNSLHHAGVSAIVLHCSLIIGVAVYAIGGALIMRRLENPNNNNTTSTNRVRRRAEENFQPENAHTTKQFGKTDILAGSIFEHHSGAEMAQIAPSVHKCVIESLEAMFNTTNCNEEDIDRFIITDIDQCYKQASINSFDENVINNDQIEKEEKWSFANALIFTYTVITTVGYGHIAPITFEGRLFCIIYGLIGVPLTLLTIADLGMFFSKMLKYATDKLIKYIIEAKSITSMHFKKQKVAIEANNIGKATRMNVTSGNNNNNIGIEGDLFSDGINTETYESIALGVTFFIYLLFGAYLLSLYEPELDFFKAFYFNFVTLTTVGLGDIVPKREAYLLVTMIYITFGLALTTLTIEIAADYLKRLHYFGRKVENVANAEIWFGGKKMTVRSLVKHLGDHLNIPLDDLNNIDLDTFVDSAIKVEAGEIRTLRKPEVEVKMRAKRPHPLSYRDLRKSGESETLKYVDEVTSITTSGSEAPLAEETARTRTSLLPKVGESSAKYTDDSRICYRQSSKTGSDSDDNHCLMNNENFARRRGRSGEFSIAGRVLFH